MSDDDSDNGSSVLNAAADEVQAYECPGNSVCDPHTATRRRRKGCRFCLDCHNAYARVFKRARHQRRIDSDSPTYECPGSKYSDPHTATRRRAKGVRYCLDCSNAYQHGWWQQLAELDNDAVEYECPGNSACEPHMATKRRRGNKRYCLDCGNAYDRARHQQRSAADKLARSRRHQPTRRARRQRMREAAERDGIDGGQSPPVRASDEPNATRGNRKHIVAVPTQTAAVAARPVRTHAKRRRIDDSDDGDDLDDRIATDHAPPRMVTRSRAATRRTTSARRPAMDCDTIAEPTLPIAAFVDVHPLTPIAEGDSLVAALSSPVLAFVDPPSPPLSLAVPTSPTVPTSTVLSSAASSSPARSLAVAPCSPVLSFAAPASLVTPTAAPTSLLSSLVAPPLPVASSATSPVVSFSVPPSAKYFLAELFAVASTLPAFSSTAMSPTAPYPPAPTFHHYHDNHHHQQHQYIQKQQQQQQQQHMQQPTAPTTRFPPLTAVPFPPPVALTTPFPPPIAPAATQRWR